MRGEYHLTPAEYAQWLPQIEADVNAILNDNSEEIDYSTTDLNPFQLGELLEGIGWEEDDVDTNGWQQDRWAFYTHPDRNDKIHIFSCGITFELKLLPDFED